MTVCNDMSDNTTLDLIAALLWLLTLFNKAQVNSSFFSNSKYHNWFYAVVIKYHAVNLILSDVLILPSYRRQVVPEYLLHDGLVSQDVVLCRLFCKNICCLMYGDTIISSQWVAQSRFT